MAQKPVDINTVVEQIAIITALSEYQYEPGAKGVLDTPITPKSFRRIEPLIATEAYGEYADSYVMFPPGEVRPGDLDGPLRVAMATSNLDDSDGFAVCRLRELEPPQYRGRVHRAYRHVVDNSSLVINSDGTGVVQRALLGSNDGARWTTASGLYHEDFFEEESRRVQMGYSLQFTQQLFWHVELGWEGYPTVLIPTDAVGVREVFRLRDIPEGKARRAALRHWVHEHMRKSRRDDGDEIKVREHLRGATKFRWNGMICNIEVSKSDAERALLSKAAA